MKFSLEAFIVIHVGVYRKTVEFTVCVKECRWSKSYLLHSLKIYFILCESVLFVLLSDSRRFVVMKC